MSKSSLSSATLCLAMVGALAGAPRSSSETTTANTTEQIPAIPGWDKLIAGLEALPDAVLKKLPEDMRSDPQIQQEVARLILQGLTLSSISALGGDGDHPVFLPGIGQLLNVGQPNADTIYKMTEISSGGSYRLRGYRGTLNMAVIGQMGPTPAEPGSDGKHPGPTRNYLDLATLNADESGNFDVLLSPQRPPGYTGDWWELHPKTYRLMLRQVSSDWSGEEDPSIAIERLDIAAERPRPSAEDMQARLVRIPQATGFMALMFVNHVERLRNEGYVNKLKVLDVSQTGGLNGQFYYEGTYDLEDDEALIVEAKHPAHCEYRSILLTNDIYQTTDWYNHHSSLNGSQAPVDKDGVLRVVISEEDPGVPNWLDTAGYSRGIIQGRWTHCDSRPVPSVKKVSLNQVRDHLPEETPAITPRERDRIIRDRRAAYQLRRHW